MKSLLGCCLVALLGGAVSAKAETTFTAKIYDSESNKQTLLFTYKHDEEKKADGLKTVTNTFKDPQGAVVAVETIDFVKAGDHENVARYHMSQKQLNAEGDIEVKDGKVLFNYIRDGKKRDNSETLAENFVVGPSVTSYLQRHWGEIAKGERVRVRLGVADRQETLGFEYYKDSEETIDGKKVFVVKMTPANFLIAQLVKPLTFKYTAEGVVLLEVIGRTQVKQKIDGTWRDLDAVTVYEYTQPAVSPAAVSPASPSSTSGKKK
jgi:hypothetical protein